MPVKKGSKRVSKKVSRKRHRKFSKQLPTSTAKVEAIKRIAKLPKKDQSFYFNHPAKKWMDPLTGRVFRIAQRDLDLLKQLNK